MVIGGVASKEDILSMSGLDGWYGTSLTLLRTCGPDARGGDEEMDETRELDYGRNFSTQEPPKTQLKYQVKDGERVQLKSGGVEEIYQTWVA